MKISAYKFGHPVFGIEDYYDFKPNVTVSSKIENKNLVISLRDFDLGNNNNLKELLSEKKACVFIEISCSYTFFRKSFRPDSDMQISIPLDELKNKVELLVLIVANNNIYEYTNDSLKKSLRNQSFYIEKGDILAVLNESNILLGILTSMDSIIKIRENNEKNIQIYTWTEPSIIINLPADEYAKVCNIKGEIRYQKLLVSSILQSALIHACYRLKEDSCESEQNWYRALLVHWKSFSVESDLPLVDDIPKFIDYLLQKPFNLLIDAVSEIDNIIRINHE